MKILLLLTLIVTLLATLLATGGFAQAELFRGPLSSSMGGTGRAAMDSAEAAFLNPALIPLLKGTELEAYYRDGTDEPAQHHTTMGLGAGDNSKTVLFPGALHYLRLRDSGRSLEPADGELWHAAFGKLVTPSISLGASVYRLDYKFATAAESVQWNYSLGALWAINQDMGVAYVISNLAKPSSDVPEALRQDLQQGLGFFASLFDLARVRLDVTRNETRNPDQKLVYMAGFESETSEFMILRMGYRHDDQWNANFITAGLGFNGPRLKLDYSFEKNLFGVSGALHSVDILVPF